ncbi:MAG: EAL domain-containing protein [Pseudomonadota bacterium]
MAEQQEKSALPPHFTHGGLPHLGSLHYDELRSMTVLIVDDVPDNVDLLKAMLTKSGFTRVLTAASGKEAMTHLRENMRNHISTVDAVLLDIMMPEMDGYEVCRTMRAFEEWADIPVIMVTANATWQEKVARESFDAGATDIMFKPIRRVDLMPRILSSLALKKERDLRKSREQELETELAERRIMETRLQHLVNHDDLTGLFNRRRLEQQLEIAVLRSRKKQRFSALLYIDLDHFKVINDAEGHITGDCLLIEVANLLRREIGLNDLLARVSADEYAILIENTTEAAVLETAERLRKLLDAYYYRTDNHCYHIGASIGIALIQPGDVTGASEILARADQACYVAKTNGRNIVHLFNREDTAMVTLRSAIHWVPIIRDALTNNKFKLVFQPVLDIQNRRADHYESLIRMVGDDGKLITPNNFIPVAEHMGLIHDIDLWVVNQAIDVLQNLPAHQSHIAMNINLSSYAFQDKALLPMLREKLEKTGVKAERITFEITETAAVANYEQTREMIMKLRELGCMFALDDFGAGFNSFRHLREFPVDYIKIDGSFIRNLAKDTVDQSLVRSMIDIARTLGKKTVAEFVEDRATLEMLRDWGADYAQGYYIGKPQAEFTLPELDY